MPIPVVCPGCSIRLKAADTSAGKRIKCPKCQTPVDVPAAEAPAPEPPPPPKPRVSLVVPKPTVRTQPVPPPPPAAIVKAQEYEVIALPDPPATHPPMAPTRELKACAFCGEDVLAVAKKCKHCGETLDVALRAAEEAKREARRGRDRGNQTTQVVVGGGGGYYKAPFNHVPHVILDVITLGLWLPIHLICWACH